VGSFSRGMQRVHPRTTSGRPPCPPHSGRRGRVSPASLLASQLTPREASLEAAQAAATEGLLGNPWAMQRAQQAVLGAAAAGRQRLGAPWVGIPGEGVTWEGAPGGVCQGRV